jgi:hypothetical protein
MDMSKELTKKGYWINSFWKKEERETENKMERRRM